MKHVFLIRHGRQDSKLCNVDVPLSAEGRAQAALLRDRLAGAAFDKFYTSRLLRAMETGDIINEKQGMRIERRSELNEIDWGDLEGMTDTAIKEEYGEFLKERQSRKEDIRFPGGENAEDVFARASGVFREIEESPYENILIVTHGGLIRSVLPGLLGFEMKAYLAFGKVLENTSITELRYDERLKSWSLERFNDWAHLAGHPELMRAGWGIAVKG